MKDFLRMEFGLSVLFGEKDKLLCLNVATAMMGFLLL